MTDFAGKRVLITGATRGLGFVMAKAYAARGARVLATGRTQERLDLLMREMPGTGHATYCAEMMDAQAVVTFVDFGLERMGGFDVVFHALGGGYGFREPLLDWTQLSKLHAANLGVGAEINRLVVPGMIERKSGNIVHVGSIASGEAVGSVGYNTVKAALAAYVRSLGRELAGKGIVVTAVLPGAFFGPENAFRRLEKNKPEVVDDFVTRRLPRGKVGEAAEMTDLVLLLSGPGASMMAGTCIAVDAGEGFAYSPE